MQYHIVALCIAMIEQQLADLRAKKVLGGKLIDTLEEAHRVLTKLKSFY